MNADAVGVQPAPVHRHGIAADVLGWRQLNALIRIAAVVDTGADSGPLQCLVCQLRPLAADVGNVALAGARNARLLPVLVRQLDDGLSA